MKYLRSLMQQSVTACKNQAKLIQQFTLSLLYLLIIHIVALLFFFLFRLVLFTSIDYQFRVSGFSWLVSFLLSV